MPTLPISGSERIRSPRGPRRVWRARRDLNPGLPPVEARASAGLRVKSPPLYQAELRARSRLRVPHYLGGIKRFAGLDLS